MADLICEIDGGKFLVWRAIRAIADGEQEAGGMVSLAAWWAAETAGRTVTHSLHTFGGIGLTLEHDIHLYNLRAKAWPLVGGDPQQWLAEAGRRLYGNEATTLPEAGEVPVEFDLGVVVAGCPTEGEHWGGCVCDRLDVALDQPWPSDGEARHLLGRQRQPAIHRHRFVVEDRRPGGDRLEDEFANRADHATPAFFMSMCRSSSRSTSGSPSIT